MSSPIRRILVFRIGQIGDAIVSLPALWSLREQFPRAEITLLSDIQPETRCVPTHQVLPAEGLIDHTLTFPSSAHGIRPMDAFKLFVCVFKGHFDLVVNLAPRSRSRRSIRSDTLFFRIAGVRRIVRLHGAGQFPSITPGMPWPTVEREADYLLSHLRLGGIHAPIDGKGRMDLALTKEELECGKHWIQEHAEQDIAAELSVASQRGSRSEGGRLSRLVGFGPSAKWSSKLWPEERFAAVGQALIQQGLFPVVFGGAEDRPMGDRLVQYWGKGAVAAGDLSVREAAAVLSRCRFYVGNDTGTMHLAAAVGTPCVAIFSAIDWPGRWFPYGEGHQVLRSAPPCEGCGLQICTTQGHPCLTGITIEQVLQACARVLVK